MSGLGALAEFASVAANNDDQEALVHRHSQVVSHVVRPARGDGGPVMEGQG